MVDRDLIIAKAGLMKKHIKRISIEYHEHFQVYKGYRLHHP